MGLAKTKQALLRGYAVASMSSQDRTSGPGARCFAWSADASAAVQLIRWLPKELGLPPGAPVYLNGASSGGSMALRLPLEVAVDGLVGGECAPCMLWRAQGCSDCRLPGRRVLAGRRQMRSMAGGCTARRRLPLPLALACADAPTLPPIPRVQR